MGTGKVQMQLRRQRAQQLYSSRFRANSLAHYAVFYDAPQFINTEQQRYRDVTKADLQRVARAIFKDSNRTVVTTLPKAAAAKAGGRRSLSVVTDSKNNSLVTKLGWRPAFAHACRAAF